MRLDRTARRGSTPRRRAARAAALVALAVSFGCAPGATRGEPEEIRVLVYNIHAGKDAAGERNLDRVATFVRSTGADLALLQEVDRNTTRSGGEDHTAVLSGLTGRHAAFGRTLDFQGGEYGIAVLSRWPIERDGVRPLVIDPPQERAGGSYEPRGALAVTVATPAGALHVLNTHLDASGDDRYRRQEVAQVAAMADSLQQLGGLVLIGGDFNAEPGTPVIEAMMAAGWRDAWSACGSGDGNTFPAADPVKRIDYLFIPATMECMRAEVIETGASDHRPVLVVLTPHS